ncbi:MAG: MmcQ/YjbR family DNA-binding protein [Oscillospiraceae bacterium]|nr:MmcQ/YjbR family DNA-binding protein [Oscillospiraceae bacterium]
MLSETFFKNKTASAEKLLAFGFAEKNAVYSYSAPICGGDFTVEVTVVLPCSVAAKVKDSAFGEEYVLHLVADAKGAFVGKIREEYEAVLTEISKKCFEHDVFKTDYAKLCIEHVRERYGAEPEYLWEKFPNNAVWRRADNKKWFGAILTVAKNKLGLEGDEIIEIIDLRTEPENLPEFIDGKHFFPGYHMNKKHWFTICLDGSVPAEEIYELIDKSFETAKKK